MMHVSLNLETPDALRALARFANELADISSPKAAATVEDQLTFNLPEPVPAPAQKMGPASAFDLPSVCAAAEVVVEEAQEAAPAAEPARDAPTWRRRGMAIPGKTRRTNAQIAQDDEAAALCEQAGVRLSSFDEALDAYKGDFEAALDDIRRLIQTVAPAEDPEVEEAPQIRTNPEDRSPVEEVELAEEVTERDKIDRILAEVEAEVETTAPEKDLTHEDVRDALGAYVKRFGMADAEANIQRLIGADKISGIPNDQKALRMAVTMLRKAVEEVV